jgi:hypothetical protein
MLSLYSLYHHKRKGFFFPNVFAGNGAGDLQTGIMGSGAQTHGLALLDRTYDKGFYTGQHGLLNLLRIALGAMTIVCYRQLESRDEGRMQAQSGKRFFAVAKRLKFQHVYKALHRNMPMFRGSLNKTTGEKNGRTRA